MNNLSKKLSIPLIGAASILLSSCSFLTGLEKDLTVILNVNGSVIETGQVNIFNNYYVKSEITPTIPGDIFYGWSIKEDFIPEVDDSSLLLKNKKVIRYQDVSKWANSTNDNIDLHAIFGPRPVYDLVIGWYNKPATSGCTEQIMTNWSEGLNTFLTSNGNDVDSLKIDIRGYEGDVATVGSKVNADTDVDIMIGMGANITSVGGIEVLERFDGVTIGAKTGRNIARLTDKALVITVFEWMKTDAGLAYLK